MKKLIICFLFSLAAVVCQAADVEINSLSDLQTLRDNVNNGTNTYAGKTVALNCDLKLDDWAPIGLVDDDTHTFQGTFEGNGYTVVINVNTNEAVAGTIRNCYNTGYIGSNGSATHLAGIAGKNNGGTIEWVFASCTVESISGSYAGITASGSAPTNAFYNVKTDKGVTLDGSEMLTGTALEGHLNVSGYYNIWNFTAGLPQLVNMANKPVYLVDGIDNTVFLETYHSQTRTVKLMNRTLLANNWNTLCLPFALTAEQITTVFGDGTQVKTLNGYSNDGTTVTVTFADANTMEAGKPYIIKPTVTNPVFTGVTIDKTMHDVTVGGATFKGTYEPVDLAANNKRRLFLADNILYYPTADVTINACRAYFELTADVPEYALSLIINFDGTTKISEEVIVKNERQRVGDDTSGMKFAAAEWYDLSGRCVMNPKKGIFIHNGRKEVLK